MKVVKWRGGEGMGVQSARAGLLYETAKKSKPRNWFGKYGTFRGSDWYQIDPKWLKESFI